MKSTVSSTEWTIVPKVVPAGSHANGLMGPSSRPDGIPSGRGPAPSSTAHRRSSPAPASVSEGSEGSIPSAAAYWLMAEKDQRCRDRSGRTSKGCVPRSGRSPASSPEVHGRSGTVPRPIVTTSNSPGCLRLKESNLDSMESESGIRTDLAANCSGSMAPRLSRANSTRARAVFPADPALAHQTAVWCRARVRAT